MADTYPYMMSNNKIEPILDQIRKAAEPSKFTHSFLKNLGFKSTNDRGIIPLLKALDFLHESGSPTEYYKDLRDDTIWKKALGRQIKDLYSDLYNIHTEIHNASDDEIKGAISRVTGKDAKVVGRYFNTFKTLIKLADFDGITAKQEPEQEKKKASDSKQKPQNQIPPVQIPVKDSTRPDFHYNIQIHLPATTDISVYNAIFKSIKENLMG